MTLPTPPGFGLDWGGGTVRLRARATKLHRAVTDYGQPFIVRRAGRADMAVMGFMWQAKPTGPVNVADPEFTVLGSEALFLPDAPVLEPGFVLIDGLNDRAYTPDNEVQDIAGQHVLLWGRFTPYAEHTRADLLTFSVATGATYLDAKSGNTLPVVDTEEITVRLATTQDPRIREMAGADPAELVFVGRWGTLLQPQNRPPAIDWGDKATLTVDGQHGALTVLLAYPDALLTTEAHFGGRFVASWQASPG